MSVSAELVADGLWMRRPGLNRVRAATQIALITGGDSGIGRSTAFMFAREGADIAISYLNEDRDAEVC